MKHRQMRTSVPAATGDENASAQPRGKLVERVVTFQDPEGLGSVRKAFTGRSAAAPERCHEHAPAPLTPTPTPVTSQRLIVVIRPCCHCTERQQLTVAGLPSAVSQHGKTPKTAARRRALGDITNATPARAFGTDIKASAAKVVVARPAAEPALAANQHSIAPAQIEAWAEEGVESRAGKSWAMLEAERRQRDEAEIAIRVDATLSFLAPQRSDLGQVGSGIPTNADVPRALQFCSLQAGYRWPVQTSERVRLTLMLPLLLVTAERLLVVAERRRKAYSPTSSVILQDAAAGWLVLEADGGELSGCLSGRSSPAERACPSISGARLSWFRSLLSACVPDVCMVHMHARSVHVCSDTERNAAELAEAIAALPVLGDSSPIRTWQLDELHDDFSEGESISQGRVPWRFI